MEGLPKHNAQALKPMPAQKEAARPPRGSMAGGRTSSETPSELVRICAGDGTHHCVSRALLTTCEYFAAKLARWDTTGILELDVDDASLRTILTLLRYGPPAAPELEPALRVKVLRDADYLGVPKVLWEHLASEKDTTREEWNQLAEWERTSASAQLDVCNGCHQVARRRKWHCVSCNAPVDERRTFSPQKAIVSGRYRIHDCEKCGIDFVKQKEVCLVCGRES